MTEAEGDKIAEEQKLLCTVSCILQSPPQISCTLTFFGRGAVKFWQTTFNGVGLQFFGVLFCVQQGCGVHPVLTKNLEHKASKRREVAVTGCKADQPRLIFGIARTSSNL